MHTSNMVRTVHLGYWGTYNNRTFTFYLNWTRWTTDRSESVTLGNQKMNFCISQTTHWYWDSGSPTGGYIFNK